MRQPSEDSDDEAQPLPVRRRKDPVHEYVELEGLPYSPALLKRTFIIRSSLNLFRLDQFPPPNDENEILERFQISFTANVVDSREI